MWRFALTLFLSIAVFAQARAAIPANLLKTELLADTTAVAANQTFTIAVRFTIEPGWHIYWKNPGDAGLPTKVQFSLPPGFTVDAVQYPTPQRFVAAGEIVAYGYENEVVLLATVHAPPQFAGDQPVHINAAASWLVCSNVCVPGKQALSLDLPASASPSRANDALFSKWKAELPVKFDRDPATISLIDGRGETEIFVPNISLPAEIIPVAVESLNILPQQAKQVAGGVTIPVKVSAFPGEKVTADSFEILIIVGAGENHHAYDSSVRIQHSSATAPATAPS